MDNMFKAKNMEADSLKIKMATHTTDNGIMIEYKDTVYMMVIQETIE